MTKNMMLINQLREESDAVHSLILDLEDKIKFHNENIARLISQDAQAAKHEENLRDETEAILIKEENWFNELQDKLYDEMNR